MLRIWFASKYLAQAKGKVSSMLSVEELALLADYKICLSCWLCQLEPYLPRSSCKQPCSCMCFHECVFFACRTEYLKLWQICKDCRCEFDEAEPPELSLASVGVIRLQTIAKEPTDDPEMQ